MDEMHSSSHTAPTLLRVDEAAEILGVDPRTIKRYAMAGQLRRVVLGRRTTRYRLEDVQALIESCTHSNDERRSITSAASSRIGQDGPTDGT